VKAKKQVGLDGILPVTSSRRRNLVGSKPREIKKWPDDFRGFGSNVRPKRQK
jgi:hypothetical protein